jgi:tetratricopeptide (TPR) repeat protein
MAETVASFPWQIAPVLVGVPGEGSFMLKQPGVLLQDELRDLLLEMAQQGDITHEPRAAARQVELSLRAMALLDGGEEPQVRPLLRLYLASGLLGALADGTARRGTILLNIERAIGELCRAERELRGGVDDQLLVSVHIELARAYHARGGGPAHLNDRLRVDHGRSAVALADRGADPRTWAVARSNLALAHMESQTGSRPDNVEQAIALLTEALTALEEQPGSLAWCDVVSNLGQAHAMRSHGDPAVNYARAVACYEAVAAAESLEANPRGWGDTQYKLGMLRLRQSDPAGALPHLEQARDAYRLAGVGQLGSAQQGIAQCLRQLGETARELEILRELAEERNRDFEPQMWARRRTWLGKALSTTDPEQALALLEEADEVLASEPTAGMDRLFTLLALADVHETLQARGHDESRAKGIECLQTALQLSGKELRLSRIAAERLGRAYAAADRWPEAAGAYQQAVAAAEAQYRMLVVHQSRESQLTHDATLRQECAYALMRNGRAEEALLTLESARARIIGEALARDRADLSRAAELDPAAHTAYVDAAERARAAEALGRAMHREDVTGDADVERARWLAEEAEAAGIALDAAQERIRSLPGLAGFLAPAESGGIAPAAGRPLVYLVTTRWGSTVLAAVRNDTGQGFTVRAELADGLSTVELSRALAVDASGAVTADLVEAIEQVGPPLATAVLAAVPGGTLALTLVPCGRLALLPVHAAPLEPAEPRDESAEPTRLVDRFELSYAFSGRPLGPTADGPGRTLEPLLAVADPTRNLANATTEVAEIRTVFAQSQVFPGAAAKLGDVRPAMDGAGCLHFACHGRYQAGAPLASGLELADGMLTVEELLSAYPPPLSRARLVVLAACESAVVDLRAPDEVVGLPAALVVAGAAAVVGSLWRVKDDPAGLFMADFYRRLRGTGPTTEPWAPARALHETQAWLRTVTVAELLATPGRLSPEVRSRLLLWPSDGAPFADPCHWAAFIVMGE